MENCDFGRFNSEIQDKKRVGIRSERAHSRKKVIKAEQERVILDFWNRYQNFRKTEYQKDDVESEESESLKKELKKLRQWRKQVHWD